MHLAAGLIVSVSVAAPIAAAFGIPSVPLWSEPVPSVLALLVGALGTWAAGVALIHRPGPLAEPVPDRWHRKATPLTGGRALLAGLLLALGATALTGYADRRFAYVAAAATAAFALGLCDDRRWIGARTKFAGQLAIAGAAATVIRPEWLPLAAAVPLAAFVLVAAMNSFNMLDNIDGLAAGTAGIAAATLALTTLLVGESGNRLVACAVAGVCLGFLPLNYRPRRPAALFMGDSGAHVLGIVVGSLALLASPAGAGGISATVLAPLLVLGLPILDTSLVIVTRLAEGKPIWRGGRDHASHRLVYAGLGERAAVLVLLALAASCGGAALLVIAFDDPLATGAVAGAAFALLVALGSRLAVVGETSGVTALPERTERRFDHAAERAQVG